MDISNYNYMTDPVRRAKFKEIINQARRLTEEHPGHVIVLESVESKGANRRFASSILKQAGVVVNTN